MRKLAHIEIITDINPISGADKIEVATVLGWKCVVKKGEFKIGDKIVYIEVDSIVPEKPEFEFLRSKKFRIKTIKLKGQISQGLVIKLPITLKDKPIGTDVTKDIGIIKYLYPSERTEIQNQTNKINVSKNKFKKYMMRYSWFRKLILPKIKKSTFPYWASKTDEERIQNIPNVLESFKDEFVYATEKIDYQSGTWTSKEVPMFNIPFLKRIFTKVIFVVASRNSQNNNKNSLYWQIAKKYNLETICRKHPGIIIQGEQGNSKVQGNKYGLKNPKMWIFNIILPNKLIFDYHQMKRFCERNNLNYVPLVFEGKLSEMGSTVDELVKYSEGKSVINPKIQREGIVVRCIKDNKKILSFKVINPKFLLKYD